MVVKVYFVCLGKKHFFFFFYPETQSRRHIGAYAQLPTVQNLMLLMLIPLQVVEGGRSFHYRQFRASNTVRGQKHYQILRLSVRISDLFMITLGATFCKRTGHYLVYKHALEGNVYFLVICERNLAKVVCTAGKKSS